MPGPRKTADTEPVFSGEKAQERDMIAAPDVSDSESNEQFRIVSLESLVTMKLTAFRRKDQVHLLDMPVVGLFDASWPARFPPLLAERLQELLNS